MPRRPIPILFALAALAALVMASAASAAVKKPSITRVSPMRAQVGDQITIRGRDFKAARTRNTVIFRAPSGRSAFVKPRRATRRKLVVVVPASVARLLTANATRFRLRVLSGRFSSWTPRRLSPVIVGRVPNAPPNAPAPAPGQPGGSGGSQPGGPGGSTTPPPPPDCDGDGVGNSSETDDDGDLLDDVREGTLKTDACKRDTDGDGVEDGYEVEAALDVNSRALPYPGKRPFPNALDPSDAATDYDGDGLSQSQEFVLWLRYSADGSPRAGRPVSLTLNYSDGRQASLSPVPAAPVAPLSRWALDGDGDGTLSDDERDGDGDGLNNWSEASGMMTEEWWVLNYNGDNGPKESKYPDIDFLDNEDMPQRDAFADPDLDGDGLADGADDADHDGLTNQFEVRRPSPLDIAGKPWSYVQPFNPCKPFNSDRCHRYLPLGYYKEDVNPPIGVEQPAGFPAGGPATPNY